ncbi:MAG: GNAT family N-acetyltransferase [Spirosomataceae bacterium]
MQTEFLTPRLSLHLIEEHDADFVLTIVNTQGWLEFIGDRNVHSLDDAVNYIHKLKNTPNLYYWVTRLTSSGTPIGIISFLKRDYLDFFDIGFALLPQYSGQGYAYEGAHEILTTMLQHPDHSVILATVLPHNTPSVTLLKKLGLTFQEEIYPNTQVLHVYRIERAMKATT